MSAFPDIPAHVDSGTPALPNRTDCSLSSCGFTPADGAMRQIRPTISARQAIVKRERARQNAPLAVVGRPPCVGCSSSGSSRTNGMERAEMAGCDGDAGCTAGDGSGGFVHDAGTAGATGRDRVRGSSPTTSGGAGSARRPRIIDDRNQRAGRIANDRRNSMTPREPSARPRRR